MSNKYGHLFYTKMYEKDLELFIQHDISKHAQRLYIFLSLNFNTYNEFTPHLNDKQIAEKLGTHRTTIMRARAELEDAGLIVEDDDTVTAQRYRYHLPYKSKVDSRANAKRKENDRKQIDKEEKRDYKAREKEFAKARAQMEDTLKRRLTGSDLATLRRRFGLD